MRGFAKNFSFHEKDPFHLLLQTFIFYIATCVSSGQLFVSIFFKFSASSEQPTQVFVSIRIAAKTVKKDISSLSINSFPLDHCDWPYAPWIHSEDPRLKFHATDPPTTGKNEHHQQQNQTSASQPSGAKSKRMPAHLYTTMTGLEPIHY